MAKKSGGEVIAEKAFGLGMVLSEVASNSNVLMEETSEAISPPAPELGRGPSSLSLTGLHLVRTQFEEMVLKETDVTRNHQLLEVERHPCPQAAMATL